MGGGGNTQAPGQRMGRRGKVGWETRFIRYLWGLQILLEAGPDSEAAPGLEGWESRHPLGPPARPPVLRGEAPLLPSPWELLAEQARGLLAPLLLGPRGWGPGAHPGAWASWQGACGYSRGRPPRPDQPCHGWCSWHASWCSGGPGRAEPASPRGCARGQACAGVWPGGLSSEGTHPPLCPSASPSAGARAGQRPWPPGERCCHRLPGPGGAPGGPRRSRRRAGSV